MHLKTFQQKVAAILQIAPVVPVVVIEDVRHAVPVAKALVAGGIRVIEITLRTACALEAIALVKSEVPEILVGAGTVLTVEHLRQVKQAGAAFAISPGACALLAAGLDEDMPLIPGIRPYQKFKPRTSWAIAR